MNDVIHKILEFTIGNVFGKDITCREPVHRCDDYQPGSLVELGRTGIKFFKKLLMPCGLCAAVPAIRPTISQDNMPHDNHEPKVKKLIRPSELPIYTFEDDYCKQSPCKDSPPSALQQNISKIRKSIQVAISEYQHYTGVISDTISIGYEHSNSLLDYLREESNVMPRMGAIGIGGLAGLILGLRGRMFKRMVYSSTGAITMAAICYPKKTEEGFNVVKFYTRVGYYFVRGVKSDDNQQLEIKPELSDLKMPMSFSEFIDLTVNMGSMMSTAIVDFASNTYASLSTKKKKTYTNLDQNDEAKDVRYITFHHNIEEIPVEPKIETSSAIFKDIQNTNTRKSWLGWKWI